VIAAARRRLRRANGRDEGNDPRDDQTRRVLAPKKHRRSNHCGKLGAIFPWNIPTATVAARGNFGICGELREKTASAADTPDLRQMFAQPVQLP